MKRNELYSLVLTYLEATSPPTVTELHYRNPYELVVAVVLSAQCTDKRINQVTPALFEAYPTPQAMAEAPIDDIFEYIRSVSYPNNKAKHLSGLAQMLVQDYGGEVPSDFDDLVRLPGVGRKTANVVAAIIFGQATMAVDTHVYRVSHRLGLVTSKDNTPYKVEQKLKKYIPETQLVNAHFWLLYHGRYTCLARTPKCDACGLTADCPHYHKHIKINA